MIPRDSLSVCWITNTFFDSFTGPPKHDQLLWEIDEFSGKLSGLIIAEVELESEDQDLIIPPWAGMELTNMKGWSNASLAMMTKNEEMN